MEYIQVGEIDLVDFSIDESPECAKTNIDFTNLSVISVPHEEDEITYSWDFGDGGTSTQENPGYNYPNDTGYFDVTLIVDFRGCKDTLTIEDAVYIKPPISRFQPAQTLYCNPASFPVNVVVNDNSIINSINPAQDAEMFWRWGDGTPDTHFEDPDFDDGDLGTTSHNYTDYGTYVIEQVIYNHTTGCADSTTATVYISQTIAGFSISNDSVCEGLPMTMDAINGTSLSTSTHPFGTFSWNMGNGQTVSGENPTYSYPNSGTFTITLTATNSVGCADTETFTPMRALETPQAQIFADDNAGCAPFEVTFSNGSSPQGNGVPLESFLFTFPDDGSTETTTDVSTTVDHTFNEEGVFTVTLVATDEFGCVSAPASVNITLTKPVANFTVDAVVCNEEPFTATNGSTGTVPLTYQWFVDGTQESTNQNYSSFYNEPDDPTSSSTEHVVMMIVTDANGCKDTLNTTMTVSTPVAIIDFELDGAATNANGDFTCPPVFADFTNESLSFGNITNYQWVFGDGKQSTLENPSNTYVFPGTYSASLVITDQYGCTSDTVLIDFLTIFGPTATPSWSQIPGGCGQDVIFDIGNTNFVTQIIWNLDDGNTVHDSTLFTHTYQDVNTFNPTVSVFDSNNCEVIYPLDPITIADNGINAFFTVNPTEIQLGTQVFFDDGSTALNPIVSWTWDLATVPPFTNLNGNTVSNTYVSGGDYVITLTVEDALGCLDQYQVVIHVDGNFNIPNVITPNGDGVNDVFSFYLDIFKTFDITIMNRWGNVVEERTNQTGTEFWDGKNKGGEPVADGVYFYILDAVLLDGTEVRKDGFVQVFTQSSGN